MKIVCKAKRLAEAQPKGNPRNPDFKNIPVIPLKKEKVLKEDASKTRIKNPIENFYEAVEIVKPPCVGYRDAKDPICKNCPRYKPTEKILKEIENFTQYLQKKRGLSETKAKEEAMLMWSCRDASNKRIRKYSSELKQKIQDIKRNFGEDQLRLEKTLEPTKQKYKREKKEKFKERERKIEELMK